MLFSGEYNECLTTNDEISLYLLLQDAERPGRHSFAPRGNEKKAQESKIYFGRGAQDKSWTPKSSDL